MKLLTRLVLSASLAVWMSGCERSTGDESTDTGGTHDAGGTHTHADGTVHDDDHDEDDGHAHDEEASLGTAMIGDMKVEFAQGHGAVEAGKEGHLVVKLPYSDDGATTVRAWIGTGDRTLSYVGRGEYAPSHDDYDIHAMAPDPLPENAMWWVEVEKPDGSKAVGSVKPILN